MPATSSPETRPVDPAGTATRLPRWTLEPRPGVAGHEVVVPAAVSAGLRRLGLPVGCTVLAAHGRVLAALTGEADVVAGWVPHPGEAPRALPLSMRAGSWRALVRGAPGGPPGAAPRRGTPPGPAR